MTTTNKARADIYSRVTTKIVSDLEKGVRSWQKPWDASHTASSISRPLRSTGQPYQGINVVLLWSEAIDKGYVAPIWMTYKQAAALNAQVRRGEQGSLVVYADRIKKTETDSEGKESKLDIPFTKGYTVFNVEQIEGLPTHFYGRAEALAPIPRIAAAEAFLSRTGATIRHGGDRAFYSPTHDFVQMPMHESFEDAESYVATVVHELTHWTSHPSRLNRALGKRFGDEAYAAEELIAELGAAFLCADLGVTPETREDHAAYLDHWLKVLNADTRAIFTAASQAQRATDYLHELTTVAGSAFTMTA